MTVEYLEGDEVVVAQTGIAIGDVRDRSPDAADVVALCCFFAPDDIPRRLLLKGAAVLPQDLGDSMRDPVSLIQAAATIASYGLMRVDGDAFSIHRRVQVTLREGLAHQDRRLWAATAGRVLLSAFPDRPEESREWTWAARLVPHALAATEHMEAEDLEPVLRACLLDRVARYLLPQGQLDAANGLLERALTILQAVLSEDALYASVLNHFAIVQRERGRFNAARRDARRALAIHRAALGGAPLEYRAPEMPTHTGAKDDARKGGQLETIVDADIADDLQNLGTIALQRGELQEALLHFQQVYDMRVALDGEDAPALADALGDLINLYVEAERYSEGIAMLQRAVEIREAAYGPSDNDVIVNRQILSMFTSREDADRKARDIVALQEARFGIRHPQVADASRLLASLLAQLGEHNEARAMEEKALEIDRQNFGEMHFRVGLGCANLMLVEAQAGDLTAAEGYFGEVVDVVLAAPPAERATTLRLSGVDRRLTEVAALDDARGLVLRAEAILDEAFRGDEPLRNRGREMVAGALLTAGDTLLRVGRHEEARKQYGEGLRLALLTTENLLDDADFHIRLGVLAVLAEDQRQVDQYFGEALRCLAEGGFRFPIWTLLGQVSPLYRLVGRPVLLLGVVDSLYDEAIKGGSVTMFRAEVAAPVPENWFAKGSTTLLAPDGQANVIASSEPLDPTITTEKYAEVQGDLLVTEFPNYILRTFEPVSILGGRQGYLRHFEWTPPDGVPVTQIQLYCVENARGYTATATTPTERFPDRELVLREVLRGLRIVEE